MQKLLLIVVAGILVLLFALNNTHRVEMSVIFGTPVHVRLVFLLMTTFLIGYFTAVLVNIYVRTRINSTAKRSETRGKPNDTEEDEFFLE
jgi:uncharacterized integral membrane protein